MGSSTIYRTVFCKYCNRFRYLNENYSHAGMDVVTYISFGFQSYLKLNNMRANVSSLKILTSLFVK